MAASANLEWDPKDPELLVRLSWRASRSPLEGGREARSLGLEEGGEVNWWPTVLWKSPLPPPPPAPMGQGGAPSDSLVVEKSLLFQGLRLESLAIWSVNEWLTLMPEAAVKVS